MILKSKPQKRKWRHKRVRKKVSGTALIPRLCVFRSNKHIYAQLIDDEKGRTIVWASDLILRSKTKNQKLNVKTQKGKTKKEKIYPNKIKIAFEVGKLIAEKALKKKIKKIVFDRGGYKYHGRVKALAEGAREGGLKF
jgi:large subunit ribosomal protein L18